MDNITVTESDSGNLQGHKRYGELLKTLATNRRMRHDVCIVSNLADSDDFAEVPSSSN